MAGLFVLIVMAIFWYFCWIIARETVVNKSSKYFAFKRGVVFLFIASIPVSIQIVEYILFQQACSEAVVYFPERHHQLPKGIITNSIFADSPKRDFGGVFEYIVSPDTSSNDLVDLSLATDQFYGYLYKSISDGEKKIASKTELERTRYGFFRVLESYWNSSRINYFIYDFKEKKKLAGYSVVHSIFSGGRSVWSYFRVIKMPGCQFNSGMYSSYELDKEFLIKNTFVTEN